MRNEMFTSQKNIAIDQKSWLVKSPMHLQISQSHISQRDLCNFFEAETCNSITADDVFNNM